MIFLVCSSESGVTISNEAIDEMLEGKYQTRTFNYPSCCSDSDVCTIFELLLLWSVISVVKGLDALG